MQTPETSTTLLRCLGSDAKSARWGDFVTRYEPFMRAFLSSRFPSVPADDIMQETLVALVRAMPTYVYSPKEHGLFRNYLLGMLRNKALRHLRDIRREEKGLKALALAQKSAPTDEELEERAFRESIYELALAELLADPAIHSQSKRIFVRVAINGEKPETVAAAFGVTRNSVDQTKNRLVSKLRRIKERLVASS